MARETSVTYGQVPRGLTAGAAGRDVLADVGGRVPAARRGRALFSLPARPWHYDRARRSVRRERGTAMAQRERLFRHRQPQRTDFPSTRRPWPSTAGSSPSRAQAGRANRPWPPRSGGTAWPCFATIPWSSISSDPGRIICLPGHKRLKLRPDALSLRALPRRRKCRRRSIKFYAQPASGTVGVAPAARRAAVPRGRARGRKSSRSWERSGSSRMQDDHQTAGLFAAARQLRSERAIRPSRPPRQPDPNGALYPTGRTNPGSTKRSSSSPRTSS